MFIQEKKKWFSFTILVLLVLFATGCLGGRASLYTVVGVVTEDGTDVPLSGAVVEIGGKNTTTNTLGQYLVKGISGGSKTLKISLDGYKPLEKKLTINKDETINASLKTDAPLLNMDSLQLINDGEDVEDGETIENLTITLKVDTENLFDTVESIAPMRVQVAAIVQLYAIVNGQSYPMTNYGGYAEQEVPLNPGENIIQLRVRDGSGYGRTSGIITIKVNVPRLDIRTILSWDTDNTDVDIHLFKRLASETNTFEIHTEDRHVYWSNYEPDDFGDGGENPFLDIDDTDGFGPETIVLKESTPGYYHIWVHPYSIKTATKTIATVKVILDGGTSSPKEQIYTVEFVPTEEDPTYSKAIPVYVITVKVDADGTKKFIEVESNYVTDSESDIQSLGVK